MLLEFTLDISLLVLSSWCQLQDLAKIDSAFCNLRNRKELMELWKHDHFCSQDEICLKEKILNWLGLRHIKTSKIWIKNPSNFLDQTFVSNSKLSFSQICSLELGTICPTPGTDIFPVNVNANETLQQMINLMPRVISLHICMLKQISFTFIKGVHCNILSQLTSLKYRSESENLTRKTVDYIIYNCRSLVNLKCTADHRNNPMKMIENLDDNWTLFLQKNPHIQHISIGHINDVSNFLYQLIELVPKVKSLLLRYISAQQIPFGSIMLFLEKCTFIQEFSLYYDGSSEYITYTKEHWDVYRQFNFDFSWSHLLSTECVSSLINLIKSLRISHLKLWEICGFTISDFKEVLCNRLDLNRASFFLLLNSSFTCEVLIDMLETSLNISEIYLWNNYTHIITCAEMQMIFTSIPNKLTSLFIFHHLTLTTDAVNSILLANTHIINFEFGYCPLVETDKLVRKSANIS